MRPRLTEGRLVELGATRLFRLRRVRLSDAKDLVGDLIVRGGLKPNVIADLHRMRQSGAKALFASHPLGHSRQCLSPCCAIPRPFDLTDLQVSQAELARDTRAFERETVGIAASTAGDAYTDAYMLTAVQRSGSWLLVGSQGPEHVQVPDSSSVIVRCR